MKEFYSLAIIIVLSSAIFIGCSDMGDPVSPSGNGGNGGGGVDYATQIQPIFTNNCAPCHTSSPYQNNFNLTSYASVMQGDSDNGPVIVAGDADNSLLVGRLEATAGSVMPPGGALLQSQIDLIRQWIDEGALESAGGSGGGGISLTDDVMPILQGNCVVCHSPPDPQDNFDLSTYEALMGSGNVEPFDPNDSKLVEHLEGTRDPQMPLGGPYLAQETINVIRQWIVEGAVNDG
jgi:mono/diheme cytochrome c family protein